MPRFQQSRKFKGFAFIEFATRDAVERALLEHTTLPDFIGFRIMAKNRWLELKMQLKQQLNTVTASTTSEQIIKPEASASREISGSTISKKRSNHHILFDDETIDIVADASKRFRVENR